MELPGLDLSAATALLSWPLIVCLLVSSAAAFLPCSAAKYHAYRARKLQPRGCRRLGGGGGPSTLSDQFEDRPGVSETSRPVREPSAAPWIVKGLWIYPVKSCRGVELRRASVAPTGLQYDRQFSFAQLLEATANGAASKSEGAPRWRFLTQRQCSSLALVQTELWVPATDSPTYSADGKDVRNGGAIIITFPNPEATGRSILHRMGRSLGFVPGEISFCVPLDPSDGSIQEDGYVTEQMAIWKDAPPALNMSKHMPEELQRFLGLKNRVGLFRVSHGHERRVFRCAPKKEQLGWQPVTGFADAYPIHLQNLATVRDLNKRLEKDIPRLDILRFRPNLIVTGPKAYDEDSWKRIRVRRNHPPPGADGDEDQQAADSHDYYVACRTARCRLPNVDPDTGVRHPAEPDRTLRSYRRVDPGAGEAACLGMMMVPVERHGTMRVGDTIELLETGEHHYLKQ